MTTERALAPTTSAHLSAGEILAGLNTVRSVLAPDLTTEELRLFAMVANRSGLDPFARQVYAVKRQGRVTFQTGIDGYRSIAARTGLYDGQDEPEFGPVCACGDNRPAGHPESCTVRVYRKGVSRPIAATAYWHEYKPEAGQSGRGDAMWMRMPRVMLAKVTEALALRKAFPYDPEQRQGIGADLYTADEMAQAERPAPAPVVQPSARERIAQRAAAIVAPPPDPEPEEVEGEAVEAPEEPSTPATGLSLEAFVALVRAAKKTPRELASAIDCVPGDVGKRVEAMSDVERGVLATDLNLDWQGPS